MTEPGMVIIGAGKAGARAVVSLREHGWKGTITLIGEEAHAPYDRPPLSKSAMTADAEPAPVFLLDEELLKSLDVTFIAGIAATGIDRAAKTVILADGRRIAYWKLLIATGARARRLALPGAERALMLRDFHELVALRAACVAGRRVAIIGGGFIGLELAASAQPARLSGDCHRSAAAHSVARRDRRDCQAHRRSPCRRQCFDRHRHRRCANRSR